MGNFPSIQKALKAGAKIDWHNPEWDAGQIAGIAGQAVPPTGPSLLTWPSGFCQIHNFRDEKIAPILEDTQDISGYFGQRIVASEGWLAKT
jgi:hypothetical protein